jgi:hypothetical protein
MPPDFWRHWQDARRSSPTAPAFGLPETTAADEIPNWVASTQRFVEGALQEKHRRDTATWGLASSSSRSVSAVCESTLTDVQNLVRDFAAQTTRGFKS